MGTIIKLVRDRNIVEFDQGSFDAWCVYLTRHDQVRYAPRDHEYFSFLSNMAATHGKEKVYDDFVKIYAPTTSKIDKNILDLITTVSDDYAEYAEEMDIWLSVMYGGMVAEENKAFAILKKRVKRLGVYQVLYQGLAPGNAANFSKGKKWRELDAIMKPLGF